MTRYSERFGKASASTEGKEVIWFHAASVGEMKSIIELVKKITNEKYKLLVTSGTTTSANMFQSMNISNAIHQYVPLDSILFIKRFLKHWKPKLAIFVESEIWPNLIIETAKTSKLALINAKISDKSLSRWKLIPKTITKLLEQFDYISSSPSDAHKLQAFTHKPIENGVNLKYCAATLPYNEDLLKQLTASFQNRRVLLCASTHANEEGLLLESFSIIRKQYPDLALIIVPRHVHRGKEIYQLAREKFNDLSIGLRSATNDLQGKYDIYIVDTMGELGTFYKFSELVFIGASLEKLGGHNVIEPAQFHCCVLIGPYYHSSLDIISDFKKANAIIEVKNNLELAHVVVNLLNSPHKLKRIGDNAYHIVHQNYDTLDKIYINLNSLLGDV